jgi:hypothetical protein
MGFKISGGKPTETRKRPVMRYIRTPKYDKRIAHGDDYAGDAWIDTVTGTIHWAVVGTDMNRRDANNNYVKAS